MMFTLSRHSFQISFVKFARLLFFVAILCFHFEHAFAQSAHGSVPLGNHVPPMQGQAAQPAGANIHGQPNAASVDPRFAGPGQNSPQISDIGSGIPSSIPNQPAPGQHSGPGFAGSHGNFEQAQDQPGGGQKINPPDQPHASLGGGFNQPPHPNINQQGIPTNQQGSPVNLQGVGLNPQGVPGNQQGVPMNAQGVPVTQGVPLNPNDVPLNHQNVQINPQVVQPPMIQQEGIHQPPQAIPPNQAMGGNVRVQLPPEVRDPSENPPGNQVPPQRDNNLPPNVPMAQAPHHQPKQPIPSGHPPPPHAAGVVFNGEHPAAFQNHPSGQFKHIPVDGDHVDGYNQLRHNHGLPDVNAYDHQRMPRSREEYPPDEFASMTMIIPHGSKNCYFYTPVIDFVVYYQVVRGGGMDIGLRIIDPDGRNVINHRPSEDGKFSITVPSHFRMRPYAVCFDNRKASFDEKHVSMMIDIDVNWDNPSEAEKKAINFLRKRSLGDAHIPAMNREYAEGWKAIDERVEGLYGRLHRIKLLQQRSNNFASADKSLMESNLARVFNGSVVQIMLMFGVAAFQVALIRAFFDPDSRFYRIWFGKRSIGGARC